MKPYEIILILIIVFLLFKKVEGYIRPDAMYSYGGELANAYIPGGRPAEFFMKFSPNDWNPQSPGYIFDPTVEMDV
jgi:hypothetical protein